MSEPEHGPGKTLECHWLEGREEFLISLGFIYFQKYPHVPLVHRGPTSSRSFVSRKFYTASTFAFFWHPKSLLHKFPRAFRTLSVLTFTMTSYPCEPLSKFSVPQSRPHSLSL